MKKILIAEDYKSLIVIYHRMLDDRYEVIEANNGQGAVDKYKTHHPDPTLMDIRMPVKTGDVAIKEILEYDPDAKIVAVTTYDYTEEELGVEVMGKGFKKKEFLELIERKLREK